MTPCDYKLYPTDWKETRKRILERAGNKCEFCLVSNYQYVLRGLYRGFKAYQYNDMSVFCAKTGACLGNTDEDGEDVECSVDTKAIKIVLTIAHLDHDASNHEVKDERLVALCQKCHNNYDKEFRATNHKISGKNKKGLQELNFGE